MKVRILSSGEIKSENKGWKPEKVHRITVEFHGKLTSRYNYPVNPEDLIREIIIRVEEK